MRWMATVLMSLAVASPALLAQRNVSPSGYGRILFPGGTAPAASNPASTGRILFPGTGAPVAPRGGIVGGPVFAGPGRPPAVNHGSHSTPIIIPYPVYYSGGYYDYDAPAAVYAQPATLQQPYVASGYPPDREPPVVIINQYFREESAPVTSRVERSAPPQQETTELAPQPQDEGPVFLIALTDHTVLAARAYWIEEGILHYVTIQGSENSTSMDLVDRQLSRRLNRDRNVAFGLPAN